MLQPCAALGRPANGERTALAVRRSSRESNRAAFELRVELAVDGAQSRAAAVAVARDPPRRAAVPRVNPVMRVNRRLPSEGKVYAGPAETPDARPGAFRGADILRRRSRRGVPTFRWPIPNGRRDEWARACQLHHHRRAEVGDALAPHQHGRAPRHLHRPVGVALLEQRPSRQEVRHAALRRAVRGLEGRADRR